LPDVADRALVGVDDEIARKLTCFNPPGGAEKMPQFFPVMSSTLSSANFRLCAILSEHEVLLIKNLIFINIIVVYWY
jgi:hypothetical protein